MQHDAAFDFARFRLVPKRRQLSEDGIPVEIGERAFDLLATLVAAQGGVVSKDQLLEAAWPGRVVEESNLTVQISALRRIVGAGAIATVAGRGYRLAVPVAMRGVPTTPELGPAHNLPRALTRLIAREQEVAAMAARIAQARLVSLVGHGGIGKTRLALAAAEAVQPDFPDGVWLVELAPLRDPGLVATTLAATLGLHPPSERVLEAVTAALAGRRVLLVLDNCEHVASAAAAAAETILRRCPMVRILATSREPLRAEGEVLHRLEPLAAPDPGPPPLRAAEAARFPAVELFIERAAAALGAFELADDDAPVVAEICRRLDGIPLAIELAASRLRAMTATELAAQLANRFALLTGGRRTGLPHHQSLRAAIRWSHELLSPAERLLFERLSVFDGSFPLDAALAVGAGGPVEAGEVVALLGSLVDKSLVLADLGGPRPRYRMLESTRHYAAEMLAARGEAPLLPRLAAWLRDALDAAAEEWLTSPDEAWIERYGPELQSLRGALRWCFGGGDPPLGVALVAAGAPMFGALGLMAERRRWFAEALGALGTGTPPALAARVLMQADTPEPGDLALAERAVAHAEQGGDPFLLGRAMLRAAAAGMVPSRLAEARQRLDQAGPLLRPRGGTRLLAAWHRQVGIAQYLAAEHEAALASLVRAERIALGFGTRSDILLATRMSRAEVLCAAGRTDAAVAEVRAALAAAGRLGERSQSGLVARSNLGSYLLLQGERAAGLAQARDCLAEAVAQGAPFRWPWWLEAIALGLAQDGAARRAARLLGFCAAAVAARRIERRPTERAIRERAEGEVAARLAPEELRAALEEGAALDQPGAIAEGLSGR